MTEKWIIYHGDAYYPYAEEFTSEIEAKAKWLELKRRREEMNDKTYVDKDYFAKVIEENGEDRRIY